MIHRRGGAPAPNGAAPILPPSLARREAHLVEWLEREDADPVQVENTYRQFPAVNRWIARWPALYRRYLRPLLDPRTPSRLLDVGCGGGDVARALARWARRDGLHLEVTGIDPDPRAPAFALREEVRERPGGNARSPGPGAAEAPGVGFRRASTTDLVAEGARFDLVICNHVLHHLAPPDVRRFLDELGELGTRRVLVSDIERSRAGYLLFSLGSALPFRNSYIRADGLVSIRRSFTADELREILPPCWRVEQLPPWRLLAMRDGGG